MSAVASATMPDFDADSLAAATFFIVLNVASGHLEADDRQQAIEGVLREAGRKYRLFNVDDASRLGVIAREAVAAASECGGIVVAAGGDGTINTVVQACLGSNCAFGVLPQGTFNYFGRVNGIPADPAEATRALLTARVEPVQVGLVNERVFIVNASVGLYPELLEDREAYKARFGRSRLVALWAGLATLLRGHRELRLHIGADDASGTIRTPTLFVGNNRLQLETIGIADAPQVEAGRLVAIVLKPVGTLALLWLTLRGALGQLGDADDVHSFAFDEMRLQPRRRRIKVATDGEVTWLRTPLKFRVAPRLLPLLKPQPVPATDTTAP